MHHRPLVENLEARNLLSAVTAAVHDGTLFVYGTASNDTVTVTRDSGGTTHVGAYTPGIDAGSVDFSFAPWSFSSVHVDLRDGHDVLTVRGLVAPTGGSVLGGDGYDRILLDRVNVNGHFFLDAGEGDDKVTVVNSTLEGASFHGGNGNDFIRTDGVTVWNYATFDLGHGTDVLSLERTTVYGWTSLYGGDGHDVLNIGSARLAGGSNILDFESNV